MNTPTGDELFGCLNNDHEQQIETLRAENTRLHELHLERTKLTTQVIDEKEELDKQLQAAQSETRKLGEYIKHMKGWEHYPADLAAYIDSELETAKGIVGAGK